MADYYLEYYKILGEAIEFCGPKLIVSVHTHDSDIVTNTSNDILIYHPHWKDSRLMVAVESEFKK